MTPAPSQTLESLLAGYRLCARSEGKSPPSITIVTRSVQYLEHYLVETGADTRVGAITTQHLRAFILSLRERRAWASHPFTRSQDRGLTLNTIHTYLRSIRIFFSWLVSEEIIAENSFHRVKLPRLPLKIIPAFTDAQLKALFASIDI
ncbi:phage integrase SAM-like domain-containing protein [Chloroflexota bacterium]